MSRIYVDVSKIPNAGRGVFANQRFAKGDVIEFSPVLRINETEKDIPSDLKNMVYRFSPSHCFVACGCASFYSHANPASCHYTLNEDTQTITVVAARAIEKDEELTIEGI